MLLLGGNWDPRTCLNQVSGRNHRWALCQPIVSFLPQLKKNHTCKSWSHSHCERVPQHGAKSPAGRSLCPPASPSLPWPLTRRNHNHHFHVYPAHFQIKVSLLLSLSCCLKGKELGKSEEKMGFGNLQNIFDRTLFKMQRTDLEVELRVVFSAGHLAPRALVNTLIGSGSGLPARQPDTGNLTNHYHLSLLYFYSLYPSVSCPLIMAGNRSFSYTR